MEKTADTNEKPLQQPAAAVNPLSHYYRQPKIFIRLPSNGKFYPIGALDVSETGDYAVYSMTAKDELMFKTPDALMNGQGTVEVIKSCIPSIQNPWAMPSIDVDAVLIAIRIATYGESLDITAKCPHCSHENDFQINLVSFLSTLNSFDYDPVINVDPLTIYIKPYTYKEVTKNAIKSIEHQKIFSIINDKTLSDEEKIERYSDTFSKLTELTVNIIAGSIEKIVTPEGEVSDRTLINDFIDNAPREIYQAVQDRLATMKDRLEVKSQEVECTECHKKFNTQLTLDQANFFGVRS